jgi:hypothetical protein
VKLICQSMWVLGGLAGLVALLFFGVAILGHLGVLADVGDQENRQMGQQALWIGLAAAGCSIVPLFIARLLQRKAPRT